MTDRYADTDIWPNPPASQQPAPAATERDFPCCDAPREGSDDAEAREAAYAEAIRACYDLDTEVSEQEWDERVARAVMAVADAERNEAYARGYQAAREHWKARAESAEAEVERMTGSLEVALDRLNQGGHPEDVARFARLHIEAALEGHSRPFALAGHRAESAERARDAALAEVTGLRDRLGRVEALADDEFATDDTADLPDEGVVFEQGAMWAFAEAGRLTSAALAVPVTGDTEDASPAEAKCPTCGGARDDRRPAEGQALCPESFHFRTLTTPAAVGTPRPRRYDQCDETCTTDCGHCKGAASPTEQATEGGA